MGAIASQITSLTIVYSTVYSDADQRKHQSSASLAFVWGIHRGPVNSPHKWPVTRKIFPFDDVIMSNSIRQSICHSSHLSLGANTVNASTSVTIPRVNIAALSRGSVQIDRSELGINYANTSLLLSHMLAEGHIGLFLADNKVVLLIGPLWYW